MGEQLGHEVEQLGHVGEQLGHVGEQLGHVGEQLGHVGEQLEHVGEQLEHVTGIVRVRALQRHSTENSKQILPGKELCGNSPNSYINVFVNDLYTYSSDPIP